MGYLLDTHTLIFYIEGKKILSSQVKKIIDDKKELFVSTASLWEISIKNGLGKLPLKGEFSQIHDFLLLNSIEILTLDFNDFLIQRSLPLLHRDPFDRILVAQAQRTGYRLITRDREILKYNIKTLW